MSSSGTLFVVFSGDREEHICPYGKTQMVTSIDGGQTWSQPTTINNTLLDDRDAGLVVLKSGTLLLTWFTYPTSTNIVNLQNQKNWLGTIDGPFAHFTSEQTGRWARHLDSIKTKIDATGVGYGCWSRRSTDGGLTWEKPIDTLGSNPHGPIQLRDGRLLLVGWISPLSDPLRQEGNAAIPETIIAVESKNEGHSWREIGIIMPQPTEGASYSEPHVMELDDGTLICLARYMPPIGSQNDRYMRQSESYDGGLTWTQPHPSNMWGYPPHLIRLSNGEGLATYGYRRPPFGQRACVYQKVRDNLLGGESSGNWDIGNVIVLRDDSTTDDLGYPSTVELSPGEMLTVYYQSYRASEKPSIIATRWTLYPRD